MISTGNEEGYLSFTFEQAGILKMKYLLLFVLILPSVIGGTGCPPRSNIRPCICLERPIGKKKTETTLICPNLQNVDSVMAIEPALREMEINKFLLYDSFWSNDAAARLTNERWPMNTLSEYKIHEIEVVDSKLSNLGCPTTTNMEKGCVTNLLKRYVSINSTNDRWNCNNGIAITSWVNCPSSIEHLEISHGNFPEGVLKPEFFPRTMSKLKVLSLHHNAISRMERRTVSNSKFPELHTLNLSHNNLRDARTLFSSPMKLRHLDLSYNPIRSVVDLQFLPHLQSLRMIKCNIVHLLENEWRSVPGNLRHIDLTSNSLQCNCSFKWVNSTFHINANLFGVCAEPKAVEGMKLRRASRLLNERCDADDNIRASKIKKKDE